MLKSFTNMQGYSIRATDGDLGHVKDVYFSDDCWSVRYVVVDTGQWLPGRKVLLSAGVLQQPDLNAPALHVDLTKSQVQNSPNLEANKPVSRQHEEALARFYRWPTYWGQRFAHGAQAALNVAHASDPIAEQAHADPYLRSVAEVSGYHIDAADEEFGHVEDLVIDVSKWEIRYLVIDTYNWWPGEKILISPQWFGYFNWADQIVHTDLQGEAIKSCPSYNPQELIDHNYEELLYRALGQPGDWKS